MWIEYELGLMPNLNCKSFALNKLYQVAEASLAGEKKESKKKQIKGIVIDI